MLEPKHETILIVEDDEALANGLAHNLSFEGYPVLVARDGPTGLKMAVDQLPDLIVLDLMLPGLNGMEILRTLREEGLDMQVLILSAKGLETDKVEGLKLGADDYVTKPFSLRELLARVEAALRRPRLTREKRAEQTLRFGNVEVSLGPREVRVADDEVHLTTREFDLLLFFLDHPNRVHPRERILRRVWGYTYEGTDRTVDNFVRRLRSKLEVDPDNPSWFLTVHGMGYRFTADISRY